MCVCGNIRTPLCVAPIQSGLLYHPTWKNLNRAIAGALSSSDGYRVPMMAYSYMLACVHNMDSYIGPEHDIKLELGKTMAQLYIHS